jgi:hypothetical protein
MAELELLGFISSLWRISKSMEVRFKTTDEWRNTWWRGRKLQPPSHLSAKSAQLTSTSRRNKDRNFYLHEKKVNQNHSEAKHDKSLVTDFSKSVNKESWKGNYLSRRSNWKWLLERSKLVSQPERILQSYNSDITITLRKNWVLQFFDKSAD